MTQPPGPFVPPSQPPQPPRPPAGSASVPLQPPPPGPFGGAAPPVSGGPPGPSSGPPAPAPPKRKRGVGFAIFVAFVAVLLAVVSTGFALWALKKADDAQTKAQEALARPTAQPQDPGPADTTVAPTPDPTDTAPTSAAPTASRTSSPLDPNAVYEPKYANRDLTAQITSPSPIDLDRPRVGDSGEADLTIVNSDAGAAAIEFDTGVSVTAAQSPSTDPKQCAEDIEYSPLDATARQTFRQGTSFCVRTSQQQADQRGESRQMVVVTVKDVNLTSVVLTASAWVVPR